MAGIVGAILLGLAFLLPLVNTIRMFTACTYTEPGIIPRVRSAKIDYNKTHYVAYRQPEEAEEPLADPGQEFFALNKFKYAAT